MIAFDEGELYGYTSSDDLQDSSPYLIATDVDKKLWLGAVRFPVILNPEQVKQLIPMLQEYVDTGELPVLDESMYTLLE